MNNWQAKDQFWNSFNLPAYDENTDLENVDIPGFNHITYTAQSGVLGESLLLNASIWYRSTSWAAISEKADEIAERICNGVVIALENGYFWLKMPEDTPFAQRMTGGNDGSIKRIYLTVEAESLSGY